MPLPKIKLPPFLRNAVSFLKEVMTVFSSNSVPRLGAAIAYYTVFSIGPLMMVVIAIVGFFFGQQAAEGRLFDELRSLVGGQGAEAVQAIVESSHKPKAGLAASIVGVLMLILTATGVFSEVKNALNVVWDAETKAKTGLVGFLRTRLLSFTMLLVIGFLLMVSLLSSTLITLLSERLLSEVPYGTFMAHAANVVLSLVVFTALMAALYKFLPDRHIPWKDVWVGAAVTTLLFIIGRQGLAAYLGRADATSAYGAASSLVLVLLWTYYCAQILLMGAAVTYVYSERYGSNAHDGPLVRPSDRDAGKAPAAATPTRRPAPPSAPLPTAATSAFRKDAPQGGL